MTEKGAYINPKFRSSAEEEAYWQEHSPLLEGYQPMRQPGATTRASFLSVRLSGQEIEALRRAALERGVRPSTLARNLILQGLKAEVDIGELVQTFKVLVREFEQWEHRLRRVENRLPSATGPFPLLDEAANRLPG